MPAANVVVTGTGASRNVEVTPVTNEIGTAVITITVTDTEGAESYLTFDVFVAPHVVTVDTITDVDDAPNLSSIAHLLYDPGADGLISLREAIIATNNTTNAIAGPDQIILPAGNYVLNQGAGDDFAVSGDLDLRDDVIITGGGARVTTIDGNNLDKVFDVINNSAVTITDVTIRGGNSTDGGIYVDTARP